MTADDRCPNSAGDYRCNLALDGGRMKRFTSAELAWFLRKTSGRIVRRLLRRWRDHAEVELLMRALADEWADVEESGPWEKYAA